MTHHRPPDRPPVLALFAHPDDETFGPGGTLAVLTAAGHPVHLLCATRGEAGTIGESASLGRERLATVRTEELRKACDALGLEPPRLLDHPDGGLGDLSDDDLRRPFVKEIRSVRPAILITFHSNGISGHLDHRTVTARSAEAFDLAADPAYAPELGPAHGTSRLWTYALAESRARRVTYRRLHAVPDDLVDAEIDVGARTAAKRRAVAAHATQKPFMDGLEEHVGDLEAFWNPESFVLMAAREPIPSTPRPWRDLFEGLS